MGCAESRNEDDDFQVNVAEEEIKRSIPIITSLRDLKKMSLTRNISIRKNDFKRISNPIFNGFRVSEYLAF